MSKREEAPLTEAEYQAEQADARKRLEAPVGEQYGKRDLREILTVLRRLSAGPPVPE